MTNPERAVLEANAAFYTAFAARDLAQMDAIWARGLEVTCVHPGWNRLVGRDAVMRSWAGILGNPDSPRIECASPTTHLVGDVAYVVCHERIVGGEATLIATNLFVREGAEWRLAHHQAGPLAVDAPGTDVLFDQSDGEDDEGDGGTGRPLN